MIPADPRTTLRDGALASADLEGLLAASSYAEPMMKRACVSRAPVKTSPSETSEQIDELIFGEDFLVLVSRDGFSFGQAVRDGYVGWVFSALLSDDEAPPSHRVAALSAFAFAEPSIKSPVVHWLPMNALVAVEKDEGRFSKIQGSGWVVGIHLRPLGHFAEDPAEVALQFLGTPYLWGGRTAGGLDCSGLVQQAYYACGRACPRDSDQQLQLGLPLEVDGSWNGLSRGDLVFWPGHVGLMLDPGRLLHANANAMCVSVEDLPVAISRIAAAGSGSPSGFRRPPSSYFGAPPGAGVTAAGAAAAPTPV